MCFYLTDISTNAHYDQHVGEAVERLTQLTEKTRAAKCVLQPENENEVVYDTPERNLAIQKAVENPHLRFIWNPVSIVQVGVANPVERYLGLLSTYVGISKTPC